MGPGKKNHLGFIALLPRIQHIFMQTVKRNPIYETEATKEATDVEAVMFEEEGSPAWQRRARARRRGDILPKPWGKSFRC